MSEPQPEKREPRNIHDATSFDELLDILEEHDTIEDVQGKQHAIRDLQLQVVNIEDHLSQYARQLGGDPFDGIEPYKNDLEKITIPELHDKISELIYRQLQDTQEYFYNAQKESEIKKAITESGTPEEKRQLEGQIAAEKEKISQIPQEQRTQQINNEIRRDNRRRKIKGQELLPYVANKEEGFLGKMVSRFRKYFGQ